MITFNVSASEVEKLGYGKTMWRVSYRYAAREYSALRYPASMPVLTLIQHVEDYMTYHSLEKANIQIY